MNPDGLIGGDAPDRIRAPQVAALHVLFFMTGMGALLLGPMLPSLAAAWHLRDEQNGLLIAAQFLGSFLGATTLRPRMKSDLALGCAAIAAGFAALALAERLPQGFVFGLFALLLAGFGLGRGITSINLIAAAGYRRRRASALSLLNLTWGLGAVMAPASVAVLATTTGAAGIAAGYALALGLLGFAVWRFIPGDVEPDDLRVAAASVPAASAAGLVYFAWLFFLYGGLEAGLSGWLSIFAIRSTGETLRVGATVATFLWAGLTGGRAIASLLLLRLNERATFVCGILLAAASSLLLARAHAELPLIALAILIGLGLAPAFPTLCSLLLASPRRARHAGAAMAVSSLGGALFPWLIGAISQQSGSWRLALSVPLALSLALVILAVLGGVRRG